MSIEDRQENDVSSHSRRGFLRKAAGAGLAGVAGLVATTEEASAATRKTATIGSYSGTTGYYIKATGSESLGGKAELYRGDVDHGNAVGGYVGENFKDSITYTGEINYIRLNGHGWVYFPVNDTTELKMKGIEGHSSYVIYLRYSTTPSGYYTEYPDYTGENIIKGTISKNGVDMYSGANNIVAVKIRGHASAYLHWPPDW